MEKWRIVIDMSYGSRETCIQEFERIAMALRDGGYKKCWNGSGHNFYGVRGPPTERLSDDEITKLRELIK